MATSSVDVVGRDGTRGKIVDPERLDDHRTMSVLIHLDNGSEVWVPTHLLQRRRDGVYTIDADLATGGTSARGGAPPEVHTTTHEASVPVIREEADAAKRKVDTGVVHVSKTVHEDEQLVDEPLFREEVKIDRVPIGRPVDGPRQIRQEGDTTIVPLLEEVLVVEKRLMLKEELHITRVRWERHEQQRVPLRREDVRVEREEMRD